MVLASVCLTGTACGGAPANTRTTGDCVRSRPRQLRCARLDDDTVKCWGDNASGQVGVGDSEARSSPTNAVDLGTGLRAVEIAAGLIHVCARLDSGIVKCWGDNDGRQLGIPDPLNRGGRAGELGDNLPAVPIGD